jgi:hypothetical protein
VKRVLTRRGVRLVEGDAVISEILSAPGPTHSVFDAIAASVVVLEGGPRLALLGFAGGGVVAPLRAMGFKGSLDVVDLDDRGERIFRSVSGPWRGPVSFELGEASAWLRRKRRKFDSIVEDLSVPGPRGVTKPEVSVRALPRLVKSRLEPRGVAVFNLLPVKGWTWAELVGSVGRPFRERRIVTFTEFENRLLVVGRALPTARQLSIALRQALGSIRSKIADEIAVRSSA